MPLTLLLSRFLGDVETILHVWLGASFVIVSFSVSDFGTARWISWLGCLGMGLLGVIFLLQGVSGLIHNEPLHELAYDVMGQAPERVLPDLFIIWCVAMLFQRSQGRTRRFGACVLTLVVALEVLDYGMSFLGGDAPEILKPLYLLPFVGLLLESKRPRPIG
jgi:hypothetical protein